MIKVLFLDLGETLVHDDQPLPHVPAALEVINQFLTEAEEPLAVGLVSDFHMPATPGNSAQIGAIFGQYLQLLDGFQLRALLEPVEQRVTLSAHAGVFKPDPKVFQVALQRLGVAAAFAECLFITEDATHISKAHVLGMSTLRFGAAPGGDFADWSAGPLLIARRVTPQQNDNLRIAVHLWLQVNRDVEFEEFEPAGPANTFTFHGKRWTPLADASLQSLAGVHVQLDVAGQIKLSERGDVLAVNLAAADASLLHEAITHVRSLLANRQISAVPGKLTPGATHVIEERSPGRRFLQRQRFSTL